jgi:hypothetical protein
MQFFVLVYIEYSFPIDMWNETLFTYFIQVYACVYEIYHGHHEYE